MSTIIVVDNDLDTLLTALYVFLDDHVVGPRRVGRPPWLTDAELLCLAIAQVLLNFPNERQWVRYARKNLRALFPYIPDQSGYNKRLRAAGPMISKVIRALARTTPTSAPILRLVDSTPVPCGASRETAQRSDLAGQDAGAGYGYCASHSRYFWGMRLYLVTTVEGMPLMWCLAHPKLDERDVTAALLQIDHALVTSGQVILADKGFAGPEFDTFLDQLGVHLVRPARRRTRDRAPSRSSSGCCACGSGSKRSSTPSRVNCRSNNTARAARTASTPGSGSACWPWPPPSGTTPSSMHPGNDHSSPTTTNDH